MEYLFGAIADDYTGGSDLAGMLSERGVRTVQCFGVPEASDLTTLRGRYEAAVVCLKSRSNDPAIACKESLAALEALRSLGAGQVQFKYCSTFDSTARGNIGPVTEALMAALNVPFTVAVPALPVNGRTQYLGHLFVNGRLLSESPLRHHPLNPMTDSDLVRHLQTQTRMRTGLVELTTVLAGEQAIRQAFQDLATAGVSIALIDAVSENDLETIASAVATMPLITGGSGLANGLSKIWQSADRLSQNAPPAMDEHERNPAGVLIVAGSCSASTLDQLEQLRSSGCAMKSLDVAGLVANAAHEVSRMELSAEPILRSGLPVCLYSSASLEARKATEERMGTLPDIAERIESAFGEITRHLVGSGTVDRLVVAGGETSGAVVHALKIKVAEVRTILDPGVPVLSAISGRPLQFALKSGNFGSPDFFLKALRYWGRN